MTKEYLGVNAVEDLFDIIDENYISKENLEKREKDIASAVVVGSALIAQCLLNLAEVIATLKGGAGGDVDKPKIATDEDVNNVLDNYFK